MGKGKEGREKKVSVAALPLLKYLNQRYYDDTFSHLPECFAEFIRERFPNADVQIIKHIFAPDCYRIEDTSTNNNAIPKVLLNLKRMDVKQDASLLNLDGFYLLPIKDYNEKVSYLYIIKPNAAIDFKQLTKVGDDIQTVYRFSLLQKKMQSLIEKNEAIQIVSRLAHDMNSLVSHFPGDMVEQTGIREKLVYTDKLSRDIMFFLRELDVMKIKVSVRDLLSGIIEGIKCPQNVDITLSISKEVDFISADVELIEYSLLAVLDNAAFASQIEGGEITVTVRFRENKSAFIDHDWIEFNISDQGPGIPDEFLSIIQKPLFTTWKEQGNIGLGLSIAHKVIEAHSGHLDIKNQPTGGTIVSFFLPLSEDHE
jgi:hypothetical protein